MTISAAIKSSSASPLTAVSARCFCTNRRSNSHELY